MAREYHEQIMFSMVALFQNVYTDLEKLKTETGALARHQEFYHKAKIYKPVGISRNKPFPIENMYRGILFKELT